MDKPLIFQERILVVDDDKTITDALKTILVKEGIVECAENGEEALTRLDEDYCAAIITDVDMPVMNGIEFYNQAVEKYPNIKERFIFHVNNSDLKKYKDFFVKNDLKYVSKNPLMKDVRETVLSVLNR